ncbi:MAG: hypothetical protein WA970_10635 [Gammaproteobacteria bacterium]|jgi:hypothetical protein
MINKPVPLAQLYSTEGVEEAEEAEEKAEERIIISFLEEEAALLQCTISNR